MVSAVKHKDVKKMSRVIYLPDHLIEIMTIAIMAMKSKLSIIVNNMLNPC